MQVIKRQNIKDFSVKIEGQKQFQCEKQKDKR